MAAFDDQARPTGNEVGEELAKLLIGVLGRDESVAVDRLDVDQVEQVRGVAPRRELVDDLMLWVAREVLDEFDLQALVIEGHIPRQPCDLLERTPVGPDDIGLVRIGVDERPVVRLPLERADGVAV